MKKRFGLLLGLHCVLGGLMHAQLTPPMFNTASQPPGYSTFRPYLMQDVAWTVAQTPAATGAVPPSASSAYVKAVSIDANTTGWWNPHPAPLTNAGWITFPNTCNAAVPAQHDCLPQTGVDQWYRLEFFSCCDNLCLDLKIWADNRVQEIYVNSTTFGSTGQWINTGPGSGNPGTHLGYLLGGSVNARLCEGFHVGLNYIIVHTISNGGTAGDMAGLLVHCTGVTPCDGAVYTTPELLPESDEGKGDPMARVAGVTSEKRLNTGVSLEQNVPNPFGDNTVINYNLPERFGSASLVVRDINGIVMKSAIISKGGKGSFTLTKDDLVSGAYSYSLIVDNVIVDSKKLVRE